MTKSKKYLEKYSPVLLVILIILIWQLVSSTGLVPSFMLPSPVNVVKAFVKDFPLLISNAAVTISEAFIGLALAIVVGVIISILMDNSKIIEKMISPLLLFTQTIPPIALAPLLILWLGYGMAPKIVLVFLTCFFPITIGVFGGLRDTDPDAIRLFQAMNATKKQTYIHLKFPNAIPEFFSGLRISATYALVGAVVAEWLGGNNGLGVYMTRVRKAYSFDKMFAVIFFISALSLSLIAFIKWLEKKSMPWKPGNASKRGKKNPIKIIAPILAVLLIFVLVFFPSKKESGNITLALDWVPNTNHTGFYVAKALGFYDEVGIDLNIIQPPDSGPLPLLAVGQTEYAISYQEEFASALDLDEPLPIEAIAGIIAHNTSGIVSLKDSNITSPKDLEGKRLVAWETPLIKGIIEDLMVNDGAKFENTELVFNSVTDVISALESDVDAIWIYYAWDGVATEVAGLDTNFFYISDENPVFDYYTPILLSNTDYMKNNPDEVKAFVEATSRGFEYTINNPEHASQILVEAVPELDYDMILASQQYLASRYQADSSQWGEIDEQRWKDFYDWMYKEGITERELGSTGFTNEYLP